MREPGFWWRKAGLASALLSPLAAAYGAVAAPRMARAGARAGVPVICIGNFTLGGAGKTPTAIAIARMLREGGERVFFLTRGYGGSANGPKLVDADADRADVVGDEALLLARVAPTIVARDRVAGASAAKAHGAQLILMDDGLQNGSLEKNFRLAVIDGRRGIGNARVFPAGPLRAPLAAQLARVDALLVVGGGAGASDVVAAAAQRGLPVWHGRLAPHHETAGAIARPVLAFAGIGDPDKFFATAQEAGLEIAQRRTFPDHHCFTAEEGAELLMAADRDALALLTTEKDHARMTADPALAALAQRAHVLPVTMQIDEMAQLQAALRKALGR
ncbi:MAG TPA: tetraacyldisaccharide 4'-kinase [Pseudolabrys sp.]|uniref:tetraacyldisaccharide 4'-kinase n=1 Tax=Pseudolabrys sp. TaxID=1960880 RepID=UPI002DDD2E7E|nr:tetraacyldisaccharide 4'-kinase [Pseudolabrys sp.]HEV2627407.1 tetraacyldisaccharide 4'-kinase [Pseudolabrys sp.]